MMRDLWNSTVFTDTLRIVAIAFVPRPSATSCKTSRWRAVSVHGWLTLPARCFDAGFIEAKNKKAKSFDLAFYYFLFFIVLRILVGGAGFEPATPAV